MSFDLTFIDEKQFSNASMDKRKAFLNQITTAMGNVSSLTKDEIIELVALDKKFLSGKNVFSDVIMFCNKNYIENTSFINTIFYICQPKVEEISKLSNDQFFRDRYKASEPLKICIDKFITYNMLDSDLFEIDAGTLKDACGGSIRWPYMFLSQMQKSLSNTVLDNNVCMIFGERLTESLMLENGKDWEQKLEYVLNINIQTLKRMCSSALFKQYLEKSYKNIHNEFLDVDKELPKKLQGADETLHSVINYSKLIKPKSSSQMRIFPT